jgi:hypothetical protein
MTASQPALVTALPNEPPGDAADPNPLPDEARPHSRRALLSGALGALGAVLATALGRPQTAQAAAGDSLIIGSTANNAGTSNTILTTNSSVVAFELIQNGPGTALMGYVTPSSGGTRGVYGRSNSPNGDGVQARNAGAAGTGAAIRAFGGNNVGLIATSDQAPAVYAKSAALFAVEAETTYPMGSAVYGAASATGPNLSYGVQGNNWASNGAGVYGVAFESSGNAAGVAGDASSPNGSGVMGYNPTGIGVYRLASTGKAVLGESLDASGYGLYSAGNCHVAGTLSKSGGSFRIDHPLDPANRILQHSFVESPDMLNVYTGRVTADGTGTATVTLPNWFAALNRDLRYQLTPVGAAMPDLHVKAELADGFAIAGAVPGGTVCWQLTGVRQDAWAEAHRIAVELDKPAGQRGRYLNPTEHGQPATRGIDYSEHRGVETRLPGPVDAPVG